MVGGFIKQQQIGTLPDNQRQHQPRFLAAGKTRRLFGDFVALKAEAAQEITQRLLRLLWRQPAQVLQRRFIGAQKLQLVLGEVTKLDAFRQRHRPRLRRQGSGQELDKRRFTGAVASQQTDA